MNEESKIMKRHGRKLKPRKTQMRWKTSESVFRAGNIKRQKDKLNRKRKESHIVDV